ncbi:citrulline utilization hydrolase CtlX [Pontibacter sp. SGAir0037]|uniref:citrulline utilization hydrolase CtlX n=1 Tax=Pontibacter sp. SGAir0037 TaxID=2571030 RepID=UPI0010CCB329|nr:arginine deiminase-related protein [Pontibacter sp. SGAir0037]QCR21536.1 hypothetical protein C1N53_03700 [Pontibacter sp. SGAir0037]
MKQVTNTVLMIEPTNFGNNPRGEEVNEFQQDITGLTPDQVHDLALLEFRNAVAQLEELGVEVVVFKDEVDSETPGSIFPNNWFSTHRSGQLVTYPLAPEGRREERRSDIVAFLEEQCGFWEHLALEMFEQQDDPRFLEGTGSMVLDRQNKVAYAAISPRTEEEPLFQFCEIMEYTPVTFRATGPKGDPLLHTNMIMNMGDGFAIVALDAIHEEDVEKVRNSLLNSGKEIIQITKQQAFYTFAGNMLQVENKAEEKILILSRTAYYSLTEDQLTRLTDHNDHILPLPIHIIEKVGGGSVRCMMAEIFKPDR